MRPTGSKLALLQACGFWARPDVPAPPKATDPDNENLRIGKAFARAAEADGKGEDVQAVLTALDAGEATDVVALLESWRAHDLSRVVWTHEQALAYDWKHDTARALGTKGRDYWGLADTEIPGTPDAYAVGDDEVTVLDHKTGRQAEDERSDPSAALAQLRGYALALSRLHGVSRATVIVVYVTDEGVRTVEETMDAFDLDGLAAEIAERMAGVPTARPTPGAHCGRCPAVGVCPASDNATQAITLAPAIDLANLTPDIAGKLWARAELADAAIDQVRKAVKAYVAAQGSVPLPDGRVLRHSVTERETISLAGNNNAAALAAIHAAGADESVVVEVKMTTSFSAIERDLKAKGIKGKALAERMAAMREDMRNAGVLKTQAIDTFRAAEPRE